MDGLDYQELFKKGLCAFVDLTLILSNQEHFFYYFFECALKDTLTVKKRQEDKNKQLINRRKDITQGWGCAVTNIPLERGEKQKKF